MRLVETGVEGLGRSVDVMAIECSGDLGDIADLGLSLAQAIVEQHGGSITLGEPSTTFTVRLPIHR